MLEIQEKILEILEWYHKFCISNQLCYYIIGGTMLGAVRHKGFIPWDDDADVGMPRDDYNRFIELMKNQKGRYVLDSPWSENKDYLYAYSKLYDSSTTLIEKTGKKLIRGVFLDVFPLDGVGRSVKEADRIFKKSRLFVSFHTARICAINNNRSGLKNLLIRIIKAIPCINEKKESRKIDQFCSKVNWNESVFVGNITSTMRRNYVTEKSFYGSPTLYIFEGIEVYGLEKYDEYLTCLYGNWRQLPPEDKRVSLHNRVFLDLKRSYFEYEEKNEKK